MAEKKQAAPQAKVVTFTKTDGLTPTRSGPARTFNLRAPLGFVLQPGERKTVDLGLTCDRPVHLFNARSLTDRGIWLTDGVWAAADAGTPLVAHLENRSDGDQYFEEGDTLARCTVLDDSEWELG